MKHPIRLPILPASLAALLLLLSTGLLLFGASIESHTVSTRQSALELTTTVDQLSTVVGSESPEWPQEDQLAQLVAVADVQVDRLNTTGEGLFARFWPDAKTASVRNIGADWKLLREGLLSFNQASLNQTKLRQATNAAPQVVSGVESAVESPSESIGESPTSTSSPDIKAGTDTVKTVRITVPVGFAEQSSLLAKSFESISENVKVSTRAQALIDLVETTTGNWEQITSNPQDSAGLVTQQQSNAEELLRLSAAGTQQSLFGYYTSNEIVDYVQQVKSIRLIEQVVTIDPVPVEDSALIEEIAQVETPEVETPGTEALEANEAASLSNGFITQALTPLQESVAGLADITATESDRSNVISWLGLAGLLASFMLLLSAISQMSHVADVLKMRPQPHVPKEPEVGRGAVARGAMSLRDADQLIEDITSINDGDLRQSVSLPENSHARAIAISTNRSSAVMNDLVGMTRGVAAHLNELVHRQDQNGRILADLDIRRQTETAELSDGIGARSVFLDEQQVLLSSSSNLLSELSNRSESAVNGVNQVSSSLAGVSAQVDVGIERLQRLMKTAGTVTQATAKLKQLTEKTRLQALNVSLKMPQISQAEARHTASAYAYDSYEEFSSPGSIGRDSGAGEYVGQHASDHASEETAGMFDEIHQLTGNLVQVSNETDVLISALRKDIEDTTAALKQSAEQINQGAHHTHSTSLLGKELASYSDQLQKTVDDALQNLQSQQSELSQTAEQIVRLDRTGNDTSGLTLALTQDLAGLQQMSARLEESVSGFKTSGVNPLE